LESNLWETQPITEGPRGSGADGENWKFQRLCE